MTKRRRKAAQPKPAATMQRRERDYRGQHDTIVLAADTIRDERGEISQPYRVVSKLDQMLARGAITESMRDAGEHFQKLYRIAATGAVRAVDWERDVRGPIAAASDASMRAREARDRAMDALGGHSSPCGCCAWFVLGEEMTLREWALREGWHKNRPLREELASGILVGALGVLAEHFGF